MKIRSDTPRSMKALFAGVLALSPLLASCASKATDGKSGETHFLCASDADCTRHFGNDDYYCDKAKTCASKDDGGLASSGGASGSGGIGAAGKAAGGDGGAAGAGGEFAACKIPPTSTCSAADTCAAVGCPSTEYDENACLRPECTQDDDCAADERCAVSQDDLQETCTVQNGQCQCGSPAFYTSDVPRCNPTTTTGPRGTWVSLDVTLVNDLCFNCRTTWRVTPDGHVTGTSRGPGTPDGGAPIDKMLDLGGGLCSRAGALCAFDWIGAANGPDLRVALRDGLPCESQPGIDGSLGMTLKLSTQTLTSGELSGCMGGDNVFAKILNLLSQ